MLGRFDEAREAARRIRGLYEESGDVLFISLTAMFLPMADALAGDVDEAERRLRDGFQTLEGFGEKGFLVTLATQLGRILIEQGRFEEARSLAERARDLGGADDIFNEADWRALLARARARTGHIDEAERLAREAVAISAGTDFLDWRATWLADLGHVLDAGGREVEARSAFAQSLSLYEAKGNLVRAGRIRALIGASERMTAPPMEVEGRAG
jgi:tetratricopeptide (TPR) repeat protein